MRTLYLLTALILVGFSCQPSPQQNEKISSREFQEAPEGLKINQIQVLGTHNSYAQPVDSHLVAFARPIMNQMVQQMASRMSPEQITAFKEYHPNEVDWSEALLYNHPPMPEQLDAGMRSLEIDVYYDPAGGRYADPAGYRMFKEKGITNLAPVSTENMDQPGFKVFHIADYDFRTHCTTLKTCLSELKDWSDAHQDHLPIFILLEIKYQGLPIFPNPTEVLPFDSIAFEALDKEVLDVLGRDRLITPDDVRGNYSTLEEAVLANNWPTIESARGKFIFLMLPALEEGPVESYWKTRPSLEGRVMFVRSKPGKPHAAFLLMDNAIVRQEEIKDLVKKGYLVRTRSDIETYEAKINDLTRANAAFSSGAQIVSTDFFRPGNAYGTDYVVKHPEGNVARANPVNANK